MATVSESSEIAEIVDDYSAEESQLAVHFEAREREISARVERVAAAEAELRQERLDLADERMRCEAQQKAFEQGTFSIRRGCGTVQTSAR